MAAKQLKAGGVYSVDILHKGWVRAGLTQYYITLSGMACNLKLINSLFRGIFYFWLIGKLKFCTVKGELMAS